jgi:hypothetical protein
MGKTYQKGGKTRQISKNMPNGHKISISNISNETCLIASQKQN